MAELQPTRKVLVLATGDSDLGVAVATSLATEGHELSVVISPQSKPAAGERIRCFMLDDTAQDLDTAVEALFESATPIDTIVIANSVVGERNPVECLASDQWSQVLRRNSTLAFLVARRAVPVLRQAKDARIVFIVPEQVRGMAEPGLAAYLSAKATLIGLARTLALELGPEGILVNSIACEFSDAAARCRKTLTARKPNANDVASAVLFFLSPASNFITGKTLDVNGGRSML